MPEKICKKCWAIIPEEQSQCSMDECKEFFNDVEEFADFQMNKFLVEETKLKKQLDDVKVQIIEQDKTANKRSADTFQRFILQSKLTTSNAELTSEKKFRVEKDEFAAMVSHELKTPIFPILLHCEMLKDPSMLGKLSPDQLDSVLQIELMAKRLDTLTGDILDAQKIDMNQMKFFKTKFKISEFFNEIIENSKILAAKKNISFTTSSDNLKIYTDRDRLLQAFTNLIRNAIGYVHKNTGKIQITATSENEDILFSVKDNGIGIDSDKISNLFRKFYQVDTSLKRKHDSGTGLGLVICKGIINGLGGEIWAESELRTGSTFFFRIPKDESYDYVTGVRNPLLMDKETI